MSCTSRERGVNFSQLIRYPPHALQKQAPTFGAVPSASDRLKKQEERAQEAEKEEDQLDQILQKDARERLNTMLDSDRPTQVGRSAHSIGGRLGRTGAHHGPRASYSGAKGESPAH